MNFPARLNGVQLRDSFEQVLDDLQRDEVISNWSYTEAIEEARIGKRGWVQNYWSQISIIITPPSTVVLENKKKITLSNAPVETNLSTDKIDEPEYTEVLLEKEEDIVEMPKTIQELTPEMMLAKIEELGYSIRKAADEMGISHTTLSRYIAHKIKRQNKDNDQKMMLWLEMNS